MCSSDLTRSTELYDPVTGQWESAGDMQDERVYHTASIFENGNILIAAGSATFTLGNPLDTADLYNSTMKNFISSSLQY